MGERRYTRIDVAELAGTDADHARRLWRALGFADVADENVAFTDLDLEALRTVQSLVQRGLVDSETQLAMTRAMAQSLAGLAEWQVGAIINAVGAADANVPDDPAAAADDLVPVMESLIGYVWRRHLLASAGRALSSDSSGEAVTLAVGFADLVGFTTLTRHADGVALDRLVQRFESETGDVVAEHGGRIVKTVGDEVMFVADTVGPAAEIAVGLLERIGDDQELPDLRVGVGFGNVLARLGDVYGEPVNIAARLVSIARPGSVLIDREMAQLLEADERWRLRRVPPRPVRGYPLLHASRLRRAERAET